MFKASVLFAAVALAIGAWNAHAQTTTTTTTTTTTGATIVTTAPTVVVATPAPGETRYISRIGTRYETFAGSDTNLQSLVHGLRTGSEVQLVGAPGTDPVIFTPTTRPMGYGNITRALDLAYRQLAAQGITNPTPTQLNAALNGGTITTANGTTTTYDGILQLRSQGMGWGKIAQTVGVHPGMGKMPASVATTTTTTTGVTTAAGSSTIHGNGKAGKGIVTASGSGGASVSASDKGITTAAGAISNHGGGKSGKVQPGSGIVTASGASAGSAGITTAGGGSGNGNAYGRGKH